MCVEMGRDVLCCIMSMMHGRLEVICRVFQGIMVRELRDGFVVRCGHVVWVG